MQAVVNGILTHYDTVGKGKTVLILHGWGDDSRNWKKLQKELSNNYQVITIDLPGFGATAAPQADWRLDDYAVFVRDFLKKIKVPKLHAIIAHSNGGAIAIRGTVLGNIDPERLLLLGSAGIRNEYKGRNKALRYVTKAGKALTAPLPKSTKKSLRQRVYKTVGSDMLVAEHMQGTFKNIVEDDVRADAAAIAKPTILIYGENDTATPPRYGKLLQEHIKGARLEIIPDAAHFVYQDKPEGTTRLIQEFLK
jgi:pimeloyl-ACP methyl ester carboxylesterase